MKVYKTNLQTCGKLNGFEVNKDGLFGILLVPEDKAKLLESSPNFKSGQIWAEGDKSKEVYIPAPEVNTPTYLNSFFSEDELIDLTDKLSKEEIRDNLLMLLDGKNVKAENEKPTEFKMPEKKDITANELRAELDGRQISYNKNASKDELYELLQKAL